MKRIVLAGPESTGKSILAAHLSRRFGVPYATEYARVYLEEHGPAYNYDLLLVMSRGHKHHQAEQVPPDAPIGLLDTDLINYRIWAEVVYGRCHPEILTGIESEQEHAYLLCYPDLAWEPDPLRENRNSRADLYERHVTLLMQLHRPFRIVRGTGSARYQSAEAAFLELCS